MQIGKESHVERSSDGRKHNWRKTFREMVESGRQAAAERVWDKAQQASALRHLAVRTGQVGAAKALADAKHRAVIRAVELMPSIRVTVDRDYRLGFLSVRFPGRGRLHLPPRTQLTPYA